MTQTAWLLGLLKLSPSTLLLISPNLMPATQQLSHLKAFLSTLPVKAFLHKPSYSSVTSRECFAFFSEYQTVSVYVFTCKCVCSYMEQSLTEVRTKRESVMGDRSRFIAHLISSRERGLHCVVYLTSAQRNRSWHICWMKEVIFISRAKQQDSVTMQTDLPWL